MNESSEEGRAKKMDACGSNPLIEMAFQSFEKDSNGVITVDNVAGKKASGMTASSSTTNEADNMDEGCIREGDQTLTLSDFSDLVSNSMRSLFPTNHVMGRLGQSPLLHQFQYHQNTHLRWLPYHHRSCHNLWRGYQQQGADTPVKMIAS